jgi:transcriptional regulator with GAF, ATPase, and Fis domain
MTYRLIINPGAPDERDILLDKPLYRFGRSQEADIVVTDKNVSGLHFSLSLKDDKAEISDLGSTNGTTVNGKKIKKAVLRDGDAIAIADLKITFRKQSEPDGFSTTTALFTLGDTPENANAETLLDTLRKKGALSDADSDLLAAEIVLLRRNGRLLETLYGIMQKVLPLNDREKILALLIKEITTLLRLEIGGIYLVEDECFFILEDDKLVAENGGTIVSKSLLRSVIDSKKAKVLDHIGSDDGVSGFKSLLRFNIQSLLCFPILNREGGVLGAFYCISKKASELRLLENDRSFLNACSSLIALVLENISLIEKEKGRAYKRAMASEERRFLPVIKKLEQEKENLSLKLGNSFLPAHFFGLEDDANADLRAFIEKAARTGLLALLTGETGVGKTLLAREIHTAAGRAGPFITIDCTTIPAELLESELFGHAKGAFTGAYMKKAGKVQAAQGGTLLIDEIGELTPALQGKLLRFIQSGAFEPLGDSETLRSDCAIIAATNKDLKSEVVQKKFREDLYYRLNVLHLELPPLRARPLLIEPLAEHFLRIYAPRLKAQVSGFTPEARGCLVAHPWPGNIRELENTIMRALANASGALINADDLALEGSAVIKEFRDKTVSDPALDSLDLKAARERIDRMLIVRALDGTGGNVSQAAKALNLSRNSLMDLMKKYEL